MNTNDQDDLSGLSLLDLFRVETENQTAILMNGLLEIEREPAAPHHLETLMRAAHSLKGAARIINLPHAVAIAHAMEDCFVAAQKGIVRLQRPEIDVLLRGVDLLIQIARTAADGAPAPAAEVLPEVRDFLQRLGSLVPRPDSGSPGESRAPGTSVPARLKAHPPAVSRKHDVPERVLRLTAENLNRLLGLAGESLAESRWLQPYSDSMQRLKRLHADLASCVGSLRQLVGIAPPADRLQNDLADLTRKVAECQQFLAIKLDELDQFDRRSAQLSHRLYLEVLRARMRPFADGVRRLPRMVRDLGHALGKQARLEILGENTQVDRDILERLEAPLAHLLRNAMDHGCESPAERQLAGKPAEGLIQLEAQHRAGMLQVSVTDDGAGIDLDALRSAVVKRNLVARTAAEKLGEGDLLEFLFLPGFTLKDRVTEISGRGVGLDVVQNMVRGVRGSVRISTQRGRGTRFQLQLPLTLSVVRALLVSVGGEPYGLPLSRISCTLKLARDRIKTLEGRHYFTLQDQQVGLLSAHQVLDFPEAPPANDPLPVVVLGDRNGRYGLVVDDFLGERELVVQRLDPVLGKLKDIASAALMENGAPVLIIDIDDLLLSIERLIAAGGLAPVAAEPIPLRAPKRKRVLAVDDSLTVRELERDLLAAHGYLADVAVDGVEAWNAIRAAEYDLVITDVDMPRLDGIELAGLIKRDPRLSGIPVLIVSHLDREEDRLRGLEAGADYYLTKGGFRQDNLLQAVVDLIGEPES